MQPLAYRMRPRKIEDVIGQPSLIGKNKIITRMVRSRTLSSMILYGPPGTGKTSIAEAIAKSADYQFKYINAANGSKKDLKAAMTEADLMGTIIVFIDEIHRLNKSDQDYLLSLIETGKIILIGATTESPYISINPAIRSRVSIFRVYPLKADSIKTILVKALLNKKHGLGSLDINIDPAALNFLAQRANGDARTALNALELAAKSTIPEKNKSIHIKVSDIEDCIQQRALTQDKNGDAHYDLVSALQKSIRGSDTDAALYYAGRLIVAGDLESVCRRLSVIPYEDVGLANPKACMFTTEAIRSALHLGLPEGRIPIADAIIILCLSPKSNSGMNALDHAILGIKQGKSGHVPAYLKDSHNSHGMSNADSYKYAHDYPYDIVNQQYLPDKIKNIQYYRPKSNGLEKYFGNRYHKLRNYFHRPFKSGFWKKWLM